MFPAARLRLRRRVWSKSCAELALGARELSAYEQPVPQPPKGSMSSEGEWRRASAESLESGYATFSLSDCDPEPAYTSALASPAHCQSSNPASPRKTQPGLGRLSSPLPSRRSLRPSSSRTKSLRHSSGRAQRRGHGRTQSTRHSFGRTQSLGSSGSFRRDSVVHWKAKVCSQPQQLVITESSQK